MNKTTAQITSAVIGIVLMVFLYIGLVYIYQNHGEYYTVVYLLIWLGILFAAIWRCEIHLMKDNIRKPKHRSKK